MPPQALSCVKCGRLKRVVDLVLDRHRKHYCTTCAGLISLCGLCGSTIIDDDSIDGQLHYEDWCFQ